MSHPLLSRQLGELLRRLFGGLFGKLPGEPRVEEFPELLRSMPGESLRKQP